MSNVDVEWKLIYVGNAEDSSYDQVLEEVMVGPIVSGVHRFVLQAPAPNHLSIQNQDLLGVTVILLTCKLLLSLSIDFYLFLMVANVAARFLQRSRVC